MKNLRASVWIVGPASAEADIVSEALDGDHWHRLRLDRFDGMSSELFTAIPDVVVVFDKTQPGLIEQVQRLARAAFAPVIAIVPDCDVPTTVAVLRAGADAAVERSKASHELAPWTSQCLEVTQKASATGAPDPRDIFLRHPRSPMHNLLATFPQIARSDYPVLIMGESGTGKELVARVLHAMSARREGPFIAVNCGAISESLLESELFGHVRGAFTGADEDRPGHFQAAHGGTILLDEIGTLPLHLQTTLLRVLEDGKVRPVGSSVEIDVDFRVIAATNVVLSKAVDEGTFRDDLFYRLGVLPITVPSLRQRSMDIPVLADHFIAEQNRTQGTHIESLSPRMRAALKQYPWPGNIRELKNFIQRVCVLKQSGSIEEEDLPPPMLSTSVVDHLGLDVPSEGIDMAGTLDRLEDQLLIKALSKAAGNKAKAARLLGLNRTTLVEKLKRKRLDTPINTK
jgi:DNA-binding NtrC family response regulator